MKTIVFDNDECCYITKSELWRGAVVNAFRGRIYSAWLCLKSSLRARWR